MPYPSRHWPEETWTVTVRNRWDERLYFAWRILFDWPKQY